MLHALFAAGIHPDVIVGTSVGAFNGAWVAGRGPEADIDELAAVWRGLRRSDVFPTRLLGGLRGFHRADRSPRPVLGPAPTARAGADLRPARGCVHADPRRRHRHHERTRPPAQRRRRDRRDLRQRGDPRRLPIGDHRRMPPRRRGRGQQLPHLAHRAREATTVWVLPCGYACALEAVPHGAPANALQAISLLIQQRLRIDADRYADRRSMRIVPTLCPIKVSPTDFSQAGRLNEESSNLTLHGPSIPRRPAPNQVGYTTTTVTADVLSTVPDSATTPPPRRGS